MPETLHLRVSTGLEEVFRDYGGPAFAIRLWDGWVWNSPGEGRPACTLVLAAPGALRSLVLEGSQIALGEAFLRKELDIEGDIFSAFAAAEHVLRRPRRLRAQVLGQVARGTYGLLQRLRHGRPHSEGWDRSSIAYHYDQPAEFFRPWLGPGLVYSCAYFESAADSLAAAQTQKLELICRKLRLEADETFLDIGCGWGSLVLHAAARHRVRASGITLSTEQARIAGKRIEKSGLSACAKVRLQDYRQLGRGAEVFDKIASVGMFEHVGLRNLPVYFGIAHRALRPGGVFLNHGIARSAGTVPRGSDSFMARYVFPGGELVTLTQAIAAAEAAGFEVRDVENLREHYEMTLRRWVEGLRRSRGTLLEHVPEKTYRIWLLYMAGCAAAFRRGDMGLYQVLLSRPEAGRSHLPLTREDWYESSMGKAAQNPRHLTADVLN